MQVEQVMTRKVLTVAPEATLKEASELFLAHHVSGLPVVHEGQLVGILSETDIVAKETSGYNNGEIGASAARHLQRERAAQTVADAMTAHPVTIEPWESIWAAADVMAVHDVNRLPVVAANGSLIGIITRDDLVRAFARSDREVEREIRARVLPSVGLASNALEVCVDRGIVTIAGEVESEEIADCLRESIHLVPGVTRVGWEVESTARIARAGR